MKNIKGMVFLGLVLLFTQCVPESPMRDNELVLRIETEPERLNPIISRSSIAAQIENFIYQPLAELDPISLDFEPVILEKMPLLVLDEREEIGVVDRLDLKIRPEAKWSDGSPITYEDVLFTYKIIFNKEVGASRFRSQLSFIKGENHDNNDPNFLTFYLDTAVHDADKMLINFHMLPEHIYDSMGLMKNIDLKRLINDDLSDEENDKLKRFAADFTSDRFGRELISGSGAYELINWNAGYELTIKKKADWWGEAYKERNLFKSIPEQISYKVIPDEQLAVTAMANDNVDVIAGLNPEKFSALKETSPDKYQYLTPQIPQYFYVLLNNRSPLLSDGDVRKALAHLVDQQKMIDVVMAGYGLPLTAPLIPGSKYYNANIEPYPFDVEHAGLLLTKAGWTDSDEDGYVDKEIDGQRQNLELRIYITGSELGRKIALLLQDNAKKAGVDIQIKSQKFSQSMQDMKTGNFEMVATASRQALWETSLKPKWHSSGYGSNGDNFAGYSNEAMDDILDNLETEERVDRRIELYHQFHKQIHNDVPVLFLLMPTERLLVSKNWHIDISPRRPGYFENMMYPLRGER